jgi:hypothetical protein
VHDVDEGLLKIQLNQLVLDSFPNCVSKEVSSMPSSHGLESVIDSSDLEETTLTRCRDYRLGESAGRTLAYLNRGGPTLVEYSLLRDLQSMGYSLIPERDNKSKYEPQELVTKLARYGKASTVAKADFHLLEKAKRMALRVFGGHASFTPSPLDESLRQVSHEEKSSGLPELTKKGDAFDRDLGRAQRIADGKKVPDPCIAFFRVQHGNSGPKTRLVWGYPQSVFLLEAMFAPQLIEHFLTRQTPMAFGLFKSQVSARMQSIRNSGYRYGMDFSGFDSTIPASLINFAFDVLKTHFTMNEYEEKVWFSVVRYFIHTPIMLPDTSVWRKHHGVPSGSYFTQMIDSVVNYVAVMYAFLRAGETMVPDDKILVLGDDSLVGRSTYYSFAELSTYFLELGLTLNVEKSELSHQGRSDPHFLGHYWRRGYPDRDEIDIAKRIAFPEKLSGIKDGRQRRAVRSLSYTSDALSAHKLVIGLAPTTSRDILDSYASYLMDNDGIRQISPSDRPGWASHLEEYGTGESTSFDGLALRQPYVGLYF